ncbi:MAG: hypothetical protein DHS20C15_33640 [Planctomycetota bacterium]|nr:MAG: hypothetical protein DHS20C15_33640 [Planctomycetota bacterium]
MTHSLKILLIALLVVLGAAGQVWGLSFEDVPPPDDVEAVPPDVDDDGDDPTDDEPDPLDLVTGGFGLSERDLYIPGTGLDFEVNRYYRSENGTEGPFGRRWDSPLLMRVRWTQIGDDLFFYNGQNRRDRFTKASTTVFSIAYDAAPGMSYRAQSNKHPLTGVWTHTLTSRDGVTYLFELESTDAAWPHYGNYQLTRIEDPHGQALQFVYDAQTSSQLIEIIDTLGRSAVVSWHSSGPGSGKIASITDPSGATVSYAYDVAGDLVGVTLPPTAQHPSGATRTFTYNAEGRLTSIQEPGASEPYLVNTWDASGRVVQQRLGESNQVFTVDYSNSPLVEVADRMGDVVRYLVDLDSHKVLERQMWDDATSDWLVTTYAYNAAYEKVKEVRPSGRTIEWVWDEANADPRGHASLLARIERPYDGASDAESLVWSWTYGDASNGFAMATATTPRVNAHPVWSADPLRKFRYEYDAQGNLTKVDFPVVDGPSGPEQISVSWTYDRFGRRLTQVDGLDVVTRYEYEGLEPYPSVQVRELAGGDRVTLMNYDASMNLIHTINSCACSGSSSEALFEYDTRRRVTRQLTRVDEGPSGRWRVVEIDYDLSGRQVSHRTSDDSPFGDGWRETSFTYNLLNQITSVTTDLDTSSTATITYDYDLNARLVAATHPEGERVEWLYNERNQPVEVRMPGDLQSTDDDRFIGFAYDEDDLLLRRTDPLGQDVTYTHDEHGHLASMTDALGRSAHYGWDEDRNLLSRELHSPSGELLARISQAWDLQNRLVERSVRAVKANGSPLDGDDGMLTTTYAYDANGNLVQRTFEDGTQFTYAYNEAGELISATDSMTPANGWRLTYGQHGLPEQLFELEGDELAGTSSERLVSHFMAYDAEGRLLEVQDAVGVSKTLEWTLGGQLRRQVDRSGRVSEWEYDEAGRERSRTRVVGGVKDIRTLFTYDASDRPLSITADGGLDPDQVTQHAYSVFGDLELRTYADGTTESYDWDKAFRLVQRIDPNGSVFDFTYDPVGRLEQLDIARGPGVLGPSVFNFDYDGMGRMVSAEHDTVIVERVVNSLGGLEKEETSRKPQTVVIPGGGVQVIPGSVLSTVKARYDAMGRFWRLLYPTHTSASNNYAEYTYDGVDRLDRVDKVEGTASRQLLDNVFEGRRVVERRRDAGAVTFLGHDALGNVTSIEHESAGQLLARFSMTRDGLGDPVDVLQEFFAQDGSTLPTGFLDGGVHYEYDAAQQLDASRSGLPAADFDDGVFDVNEQNAAPFKMDYQYDALFNRDFMSVDAGAGPLVLAFVTGLLNELQSFGSETITSDLDGSYSESTSGRELHYDAFGHVATIKENGGLTRLFYDPLGRRIETHDAQAGTTETLAYWGHHAIERTVDEPGLTRVFEHHYSGAIDDTLEIARKDTGEQFQVFADWRSSASVLTDEVGAIRESYRYSDFGNRYRASAVTGQLVSGGDSLIGNPVGFQGRWHIDGMGSFLDFRNRLYLPEVGRFATPDPLGFPDGRNRFHFVHNNPHRRDPYGLNEPGSLDDPAGKNTHAGLTKAAMLRVMTDFGSQAVPSEFELTAVWANIEQDNSENKAWPFGDNRQNIEYHALGNDITRRIWLEFHTDVLADACDATNLGKALHFVQDFVAHRDADGNPYENEDWGHAADSAEEIITPWDTNTDPDNLIDGPLKIQRMAESIDVSEMFIRAFLERCGPNDGTGGALYFGFGGKPNPNSTTKAAPAGAPTRSGVNGATSGGGGVNARSQSRYTGASYVLNQAWARSARPVPSRPPSNSGKRGSQRTGPHSGIATWTPSPDGGDSGNVDKPSEKEPKGGAASGGGGHFPGGKGRHHDG